MVIGYFQRLSWHAWVAHIGDPGAPEECSAYSNWRKVVSCKKLKHVHTASGRRLNLHTGRMSQGPHMTTQQPGQVLHATMHATPVLKRGGSCCPRNTGTRCCYGCRCCCCATAAGACCSGAGFAERSSTTMRSPTSACGTPPACWPPATPGGQCPVGPRQTCWA